MGDLLYTYYGDDFTGSTDVLEQLARGGVRSALFFAVPTQDDLARMPGLQAIGVAGESRSRTPEWMTAELPRIFAALRALGAPVMQYKVCSTFDSSPRVGSIGRALEIGLDVFGARVAPVVVGAPHLRRFVWQGMLFASDPLGKVHRIDRHPMSRHPVTPMHEPRLAVHLQEQTSRDVCAVPVNGNAHELREFVERVAQEGVRAVVFDTVQAEDLHAIGEYVWHEAARAPLFAVGSSGLTAALLDAWREAGVIAGECARDVEPRAPRGPLLVVSGSCSAATERQLRWAGENGFAMLPADPAALLAPGTRLHEELAQRAAEALRMGRDAVIYTAMGTPAQQAHGDGLGRALGDVLARALELTDVRRVLLCGGDTSSHAVAQLGLRALTWRASVQTGAPLCVAHADGPLDGLELVLKGGQMGSEDFFRAVRDA